MKSKKSSVTPALLTLMLLSMTFLSSCKNAPSAPPLPTAEPSMTPVPIMTVAPAVTAAPVKPPEPTDGPRMQVGDTYDGVVTLDGMEETVHYMHIRNDTIGIEMDYLYEHFQRDSSPDRERFVSVNDNQDPPEIYLDVIYSAEDAETIAASVSEALSEEYDIYRDPFTMNHAGTCIHIDASSDKTVHTPDTLQAVYIIPAADGCRIATVRYTFDSADGFGALFRSMVKTIEAIDRSAQ